MKRLHIDRIRLQLKGVDVRTAEAAARLLGPALAEQLAAPEKRPPQDSARGALRLSAPLSAESLSQAVAERVSSQVRAQLASVRNTKKSAD
jgi:hypothetical protein